MYDDFNKEKDIKDKTEKEKERELLDNINKVKNELILINNNYNYAEDDMIDYYLYQLKANQSKLDYLIKFAKKKGITVDMAEAVKIKIQGIKDQVG